MNLARYRPQNASLVKKNQPDLFNTVKQTIPDLTPEQFSRVTGLIIEYVLQSGGDDEIFQSDDLDFEKNDDDYIDEF